MKKYLDNIQSLIENHLPKDGLEHDFVGTRIALVCAIVCHCLRFSKVWVLVVTFGFGLAKEFVDKFIRKKEFSWSDLTWTVNNSILIFALI